MNEIKCRKDVLKIVNEHNKKYNFSKEDKHFLQLMDYYYMEEYNVLFLQVYYKNNYYYVS